MYFPFPQAFAPPPPPQYINPLFQFLPPHLQQQGKTQYNYHTPDGGVPMEGKVPSGSAFDPPKPAQQPFFPMMQGNCVPGAQHPFPYPNMIPGPIQMCGPPPPPLPLYSQPPPCYASPAPSVYSGGPASPAYHCAPVTPGPPASPATIAALQSQTQKPPPAHEFYSTGERAPPLQGNRVKGQLPAFDNGMGYIFPKNNCTIHIFEHNLVTKYPPLRGSDANQGATRIRFNIDNESWSPQTVSCDMTFKELIEQVECVKRANAHPPYDQPGRGYPPHLIGLQELLPMGDGTYVLGTLITLTSCQANSRVGEIWPDTVGSAGGEKPKLVVRWPV